MFSPIAKLLKRIRTKGVSSQLITPEVYSFFIASGGAKDIRELRSEILDTKEMFKDLRIPNRYISYEKNFQDLFFQKAISSIFWSDFTKACAYSRNRLRKVIFAIPPEFMPFFPRHRIPLNKFACTVLWKVKLYKKGMKNFGQIVGQFFDLLSRPKVVKFKVNNPRVKIWTNFHSAEYFNSDYVGGYNFVNWLSRDELLGKVKMSFFCERNLGNHIYRNCSVEHLPISMLAIPVDARRAYLLDMLSILWFGFTKMITGKPEFMTLGMELALALRVQKVEYQDLPSFAFFSEADGICKPLWAYVAELKGVKVITLFATIYASPQSSNKVSFNRTDLGLNLYSGATWNNYWVCDSTQKHILQKFVDLPSEKIKIVGVHWRTDLQLDKRVNKRWKVALFDNEDQKDFFNFSSIVDLGFVGHEKDVKFLRDIASLAIKYNVEFAHKRKRTLLEHFVNPEYTNLLEKLRMLQIYTPIHEDIAPLQLIRKSDYVLCPPFSTPAVIAKDENVPSLYYDCIGKTLRSDISLHGVPLIQGYQELEIWFEKNFGG